MSKHSLPSFDVVAFNAALNSGPYAWPGGYPLYFITADGAAVSFFAAEANADQIREAIQAKDTSGGWCVVACVINWEDPDLFCDVSGRRIESAYAEDKADS